MHRSCCRKASSLTQQRLPQGQTARRCFSRCRVSGKERVLSGNISTATWKGAMRTDGRCHPIMHSSTRVHFGTAFRILRGPSRASYVVLISRESESTSAASTRISRSFRNASHVQHHLEQAVHSHCLYSLTGDRASINQPRHMTACGQGLPAAPTCLRLASPSFDTRVAKTFLPRSRYLVEPPPSQASPFLFIAGSGWPVYLAAG